MFAFLVSDQVADLTVAFAAKVAKNDSLLRVGLVVLGPARSFEMRLSLVTFKIHFLRKLLGTKFAEKVLDFLVDSSVVTSQI